MPAIYQGSWPTLGLEGAASSSRTACTCARDLVQLGELPQRMRDPVAVRMYSIFEHAFDILRLTMLPRAWEAE